MIWLRSQNNKRLLAAKEVRVEGRHVVGFVGVSFLTEWKARLGTYASEERAVAVLNEIVEQMAQRESVVISLPQK